MISSCAVFCDGRFGGGPAGSPGCGLGLVSWGYLPHHDIHCWAVEVWQWDDGSDDDDDDDIDVVVLVVVVVSVII